MTEARKHDGRKCIVYKVEEWNYFSYSHISIHHYEIKVKTRMWLLVLIICLEIMSWSNSYNCMLGSSTLTDILDSTKVIHATSRHYPTFNDLELLGTTLDTHNRPTLLHWTGTMMSIRVTAGVLALLAVLCMGEDRPRCFTRGCAAYYTRSKCESVTLMRTGHTQTSVVCNKDTPLPGKFCAQVRRFSPATLLDGKADIQYHRISGTVGSSEKCEERGCTKKVETIHGIWDTVIYECWWSWTHSRPLELGFSQTRSSYVLCDHRT